MEKKRKIIILLALITLFLVITIILIYKTMLSPVSKDQIIKIIVIPPNTSVKKIGTILEENNLIRSDNFFSLYVKINNINNLKAGTYNFKSNMNLKEIVKILREGNSYNNETIHITFKEGINFRELARVIAANTNNTYEEVLDFGSLKNKDYLNSLIEDYWFLTENILKTDLYYPLEGYLYPDTYQFRSKEVTISEIFKKLLDQMSIVLEPYQENLLPAHCF